MKLKEYFHKRTYSQLQAELKELDNMIDDVDCFGVNDLLLRDAIAKEIDRRDVQDCLLDLNDILCDVFETEDNRHIDIFVKYTDLKEAIHKKFE